MLLTEQAISSVIGTIDLDDFYSPNHRAICSAIFELYEQGQEVDPVTVAAALKATGDYDKVGGGSTLITLQSRTPSTSNAAGYAAIVREMAVRRSLIAFGSELVNSGYDPGWDTPSALKSAEDQLYSLSARLTVAEELPAGTMASRALDEIVQGWLGPDQSHVRSGFPSLDEITGGFHPSRFYIVGARPAMGKSALAANIASHVATTTEDPVLFFSLEMDAQEVAHRMNTSMALVGSHDIKSGWLSHADWVRMKDAQSALNQSSLIIDDSTNTSILDVYAKAKKVKMAHGKLGIVIIDYIQLMSSGSQKFESRQMEISNTSRRLKLMARELECPVVALSQLSRQLELRADKRPILADLRESGSLEQDSDCVIFLYRDEVYVPDSEDSGFAEVIVAKNRQGPTGTVKLAWLAPMVRFANVSRVA